MERSEISETITNILTGCFPDEYYCSKCCGLIADKKTADLIEEMLGGYSELCECEHPMP